MKQTNLFYLIILPLWLSMGCTSPAVEPELVSTPDTTVVATEMVAQMPTVAGTSLVPTNTAVPPTQTPTPVKTPTPTPEPLVIETYDLSLIYTPTPAATPRPLVTLAPDLPPLTGQVFMVWDRSPVNVLDDNIEYEVYSPRHQHLHMTFNPAPTITELDFNTQPTLAYAQISDVLKRSPDGQKMILILMTDTNSSGEIEAKGYETDNLVLYLYDLKTGAITPLVTTEEEDIYSVAWSPDSQSILYTQRDKLIRYQLQDASREIVLQVPEASLSLITLSPNGETLALRAIANPPQILFYNTTTEQIVDTVDEFLATLLQSSFWSADSQWLAIPHAHYGRQEYQPLVLYNAATQQIISVPKPEDYIHTPPAWSPNGQQLAFTRNRATLSVWSRDTLTSTNILTADYVSAPLWTTDQQILVGVVEEDGGQIMTLDLDTDTPQSWPLNLGYAVQKIHLLSWSPDGNWLAFKAMGEAGTASGVYLIPSGGGKSYQLIDMLGHETVSHFEWISDPLTESD